MSTVLYWYDEDAPFRTHEIRFGAVVAESHEDLVTITEHPVESGSKNADHAKDEPERLTIEGVVSTVLSVGDPGTTQAPRVEQMPVQLQGPPRAETHRLPEPPIQPSPAGLVSAGIRSLSGGLRPVVVRVPTYVQSREPVTVQAVERSIPGDRPREIYESLLEAKQKKAFFVVSTRFRDYFDMMLERVALIRAPEDGSSGRFQIDLKRVVVTSTETVAAPVPAEARGAAPRNRGAQAAKPAETPAPSQMKSSLFRAGEGVGLF